MPPGRTGGEHRVDLPGGHGRAEQELLVADPGTEALAQLGRPTAPVDPDVADRILSRSRARELMAEPPPPAPGELRNRFGSGISDEEFLLRATMPAGEVDAMLAAGPARRHYNPDLKPVLDLLAGLAERPAAIDGVSGMVVDKPGFRLELHAGRPEGAARA